MTRRHQKKGPGPLKMRSVTFFPFMKRFRPARDLKKHFVSNMKALTAFASNLSEIATL